VLDRRTPGQESAERRESWRGLSSLPISRRRGSVSSTHLGLQHSQPLFPRGIRVPGGLGPRVGRLTGLGPAHPALPRLPFGEAPPVGQVSGRAQGYVVAVPLDLFTRAGHADARRVAHRAED
jgi:hypothetical protein